MKPLIIFSAIFFNLYSAAALSHQQQILSNIIDHSKEMITDQLSITASNDMERGKILYFISFSMPLHLIEAYIKEAAIIQGSVVLRGIDSSSNLRDFIINKIMPLTKSKNETGNILIDPRLFTAYEVNVVPTIVFAPHSDSYNDHDSKTSNEYWKVSGSVTTEWALEAMLSHNAPVQFIKQRLSNLSSR